MPTIKVKVENKIALNMTPQEQIVCHNSDYEVEFQFDAEWENHIAKTAYFVYNDISIAVPFKGNKCEVPKLKNTTVCKIGVQAGDIKTTTSAYVQCKKAIVDEGGETPEPPTESVYNKIIELVNGIAVEVDGLGATVELSVDKDYVLTIVMKNLDGDILSQSSVDLPIESLVVSAKYDNTEKSLIFTLQNGETLSVPLDDIVGGIDEEAVKKIVQETAVTKENDPTVHDWAKKPQKPNYTYEEIMEKPTLVENINATVNEETYEFTIELKDKEGNVVSETKVNLPINNLDLSEYVKFTDYATKTKGGVVKTDNSFGVSTSYAGNDGFISTVPATKALINGKTDIYRPIVSCILDYATMSALADCKQPELWTDDTTAEDGTVTKGTKTKACELLGAIPKIVADSSNYRVVTKNTKNEYVGQLLATNSARATIGSIAEFLNETVITTEPQGSVPTKTPTVPYASANKNYVDNLPDYLTLTDDEKTKWVDMIGAVKAVTTPDERYQLAYVLNADGTQGTMRVSQWETANTIVRTDAGGRICSNKPISATQVANKDYVDNLPDYLTLTDEQKAKWKTWLESILA